MPVRWDCCEICRRSFSWAVATELGLRSTRYEAGSTDAEPCEHIFTRSAGLQRCSARVVAQAKLSEPATSGFRSPGVLAFFTLEFVEFVLEFLTAFGEFLALT